VTLDNCNKLNYSLVIMLTKIWSAANYGLEAVQIETEVNVAESYLVEERRETKRFEKYRIDAVCILGNEVRHYENIG